jgi:ribosome-associated protein
VLDVRSKTDIADYFIIVSGYSTAHIKALAGEVEHTLKQHGIPCYRISGTPASGWIILDYIDVVLHIFSLQAREYYSLEELWEDSKQTG